MDFLNLHWLAWLAGTVASYWIAPREWRDLVLAGLSLAFLALYSWQSAGILAGYTILLFSMTRATVVKTLPAIVTALIMVGTLVWFKIQQDAAGIVENLIPLGLSYYTFRCLHFLLERYKGRVGPASLRELIGYLIFLPTMVVGPIHRFPEYLHDRQRQRWDAAMLSHRVWSASCTDT